MANGFAEDPSVLTVPPFVQLHPEGKPTQKNSLEDVEDWDQKSYMVAKRRKRQSQFDSMLGVGKAKSAIFEGVTVYVNGWTQPSAAELKEMIYEHGGRYEYNLYSRPHVTHTIATNLPNSKILNLGQSVVCRPDWIVDSIAANQKLPVEKYLLYKIQDGQTKLEFSKQVMHRNSTEIKDNFISDSRSLTEMNDSNLINSSKKTDFVKEFFTHSRLHYLSTWSMELKQFMAEMLKRVSPKIPKLPAPTSLRAAKTRAVVHIDIDCFFVSVSIRNQPHLRGKPVAVTHAKKTPPQPSFPLNSNDNLTHPSGENPVPVDATLNVLDSVDGEAAGIPGSHHKIHDSTSDIASCSYEARQFGISNGMSVGAAMRRCPNLILLPYNFDAYRDVSRIFYTIMLQYSSVIEAVSCDEAYMELTDYCSDFEHVSEIVRELREEVLKQTGCTVSAGISHNMLLARMSTRVAKPDGQFILSPAEVEHFLSSQNVRDLPGVGYSTASKIQEIGINNCGELSSIPLAKLRSVFGTKIGKTLHDCARGIDDRELKLSTERKSISVDINFGIRFQEISEAEALLGNLAEELQHRAEEAGVSGTQLTLKMKIRKQDAPRETKKYLGHGACDNISRSMSLLQATREATECCRLAVRLLKQVKPAAKDVRGMGLQLSKLVSYSGGSSGAGSGGGEEVGSCYQGQLLKFFKPAAKPIDKSKAPHYHAPPSEYHHQIQLQHPHHHHHQQGQQQLLSKTQSPSSSKSRRKRQTVAASGPSLMHSPFKESPSKSSHSPAKSPAKSLKDYFRCSSNICDTINSSTSGTATISNAAAVATVVRPSSTAARNLDESFAFDLPPASQLDHSVLDALPPQLREKIMEGYSKRGQEIYRVAPKKERITAREEEEESAIMVVSAGVVCDNYGRLTTEVDKKEQGHQSKVKEEEEIVISDEDRFLEDWKIDIREWVDIFCEGPLESDVLAVAGHFCKLASSNLKMVEVCLKIFRRFLASRGLMVWCPCFNFLTEQIQERVKIVYGGVLKIDPLFLGTSL